MMRRRIPCVLAAVLAAASVPRPALADRGEASAAKSGDTITLAVGETRTISARDVRNYSEGSAGIIDIRLTPDATQFVITGRHQGSTTLLLIKADGSQATITIDVFLRSPEAVERELGQLLSGLPGVKAHRVGALIVIDGTVGNQDELTRVQHVASLYPGEVESLASVSGGGTTGIPSGDLQRYLIRVDFYFVQYDTNYSYDVGISWPGIIGGQFLQAQVTYDFLKGIPQTATASIASQPLPGLDIASTKGWAKVLRQATVITNNGVEAAFSNGGEQNFTVTTGLGVGIQRIPFGTDLTVLPRYVPQQHQLEVKLNAEVSDLTAAVNGTNLPGRNIAKLATNVSLKLGESIVLSGIRAESTTHTISGIPGLKDIPVLGILFGTHSDATELTEGAIFIVPSVIEPAPNAARELVTNAMRTYRDFSGNMDNLHTYDRTPPVSVGGAPAQK